MRPMMCARMVSLVSVEQCERAAGSDGRATQSARKDRRNEANGQEIDYL